MLNDDPFDVSGLTGEKKWRPKGSLRVPRRLQCALATRWTIAALFAERRRHRLLGNTNVPSTSRMWYSAGFAAGDDNKGKLMEYEFIKDVVNNDCG
jgi:hypothetical protein